MNNNVIKSICWDITSRCNDCCGFCYRNSNNAELDLNGNKIILKKLIDFGVDKISFVGGEPLLYTELFELVQWGKMYAKGKTVFSITTNAILLTDLIDGEIKVNEEKLNRLLEVFDWLTLSLDGPNREIQGAMGRNQLHFDRVIIVLDYLYKKKCQSRLKVNTVVSKVNIGCLLDIYKLLSKYNIERWKLFRFLPSRGSALERKDSYYISEEMFLYKVQEINQCIVNGNIRLSVNGYDNFDNSYITISSEGKLVVYDNGQYINKMDLLVDDMEDIFKFIDMDGHVKKRSDFLSV